MRALAVALFVTALLGSGCGNACQDLGERLCNCTPPGTTKSSCIDSVKAEIQRFNPNDDEQAVCEKKLRTCYARKNPETGDEISFCDWLDGRCGKASCGISEEDYKTLSGTTEDGQPITPNPADPAKPLCPP